MRSVLMEFRENGGDGSLTTDLAARANVALSAVTAGTSAFGDMLRLERPFDIPLKPAGVMNPLAKTAGQRRDLFFGKRKPRASDDNNGPKRSGSKAGAAAESGGASASVSKATESGGTDSLDTETSRKIKALKTTAKEGGRQGQQAQ
ncbi:unnamed protein product [Ectocarpus sp. 8 AP-2014]